MAANQVFLAAVTVAELRYAALVAEWEANRRTRLEESIQATTVVPVTDNLLTRVADALVTRSSTERMQATSGSLLRRSTSERHCSRPTRSSITLPA